MSVATGIGALRRIFGVHRARRVAAGADAIRAPHAPWLCRPDWAAGRIEDSSRGTMVAAWIRIAAREIAEVTTRIGMQAGGTPYYDLILVRKDGRQVPAGRAIRDKREAEWLADTVQEALRT